MTRDPQTQPSSAAVSSNRLRLIGVAAEKQAATLPPNGWQQLIVACRPAASATAAAARAGRRGREMADAGSSDTAAQSEGLCSFAELIRLWPERTQRIVLIAALMPRLTAAGAIELTRDPDAGAVLERLAKKGSPVFREEATPVAYKFSAAFRDYAKVRARTSLAPEELAEVLWRATLLLERQLVHSLRPAPAVQAQPSLAPTVRICALGGFFVFRDGKPLPRSRKAAARVFALLKALVVFGGEGVAAYKLADVMWPDVEGDIGIGRLNSTLYRARKLLGASRALLVQDGVVSLNRAIVVCDVFDFEQTVRELEGDDVPPSELSVRLLRAYPGSLLPDHAAQDGVRITRERLAAKFISAVLKVGSRLEAEGDTKAARALYFEAMAREPLAGSLQRLLGDGLGESGPAHDLNGSGAPHGRGQYQPASFMKSSRTERRAQ